MLIRRISKGFQRQALHVFSGWQMCPFQPPIILEKGVFFAGNAVNNVDVVAY
jgi:hypothetical protein